MTVFALTMRDPESSTISRFHYDTGCHAITDADGNPVGPARRLDAGKRLGDWHPVSPEHPGRKTGRVTRLRIQLGLGCNYSCAYCSQAAFRGREAATDRKDARTVLGLLGTHLEGDPARVEFWGGEPLVYWEKIKVLVPALRERWPGAQFLLITNGTLLNDEKIDFFGRHRFTVAISHDGPGQSARGPDPMEDPAILAAWQGLYHRLGREQMSFNTVLTPGNSDPVAIADWFVARTGIPDAPLTFEGVVTVHDAQGYPVEFGMDEQRQMMTGVMTAFYSGRVARHGLFGGQRGFLQGLAGQTPLAQMGQGCGMDREDVLAVDLAGNVLTCHNTAGAEHHIGHLSNLPNARLDTAWHFSHREGCSSCPVVRLCGGGCMYLQGEEWRRSCAHRYPYYLALLSGYLWTLTGRQLIHLEKTLGGPPPEGPQTQPEN